ncbi:MAG: hypothetical protein OER04_16085 [Cyclobacteriaceae bacterium]|nr:hypothetical protein [Cyclobacteriaceae bacterium]
MKLLVFFLALAVVELPDASLEIQKPQQIQQDDKRQIDPQDLPEVVTKALEESQYSVWTVEKAYQLVGPAEETFELHLVQEDQKIVLLADAKGNLQSKTDS